MREYNRFSGTLVHLNIFRLGQFRDFSVAWFTQDDISSELNSPISALNISFATIFFTLISHIPDLSSPSDVVYNGDSRLSISFSSSRNLHANIGD